MALKKSPRGGQQKKEFKTGRTFKEVLSRGALNSDPLKNYLKKINHHQIKQKHSETSPHAGQKGCCWPLCKH